MKKTLLVTAITVACVLVLLVAALMPHKNGIYLFFGVVYAQDSYGDDVVYIEVWQHNGTAYALLLNTTSTNQTVALDGGKSVRFFVCVRLNDTLAPNNDTAVTRTQIFMNITYNTSFVWTNEELNNTSSIHDGNYYYVKESGDWTSDLPQDGVEYTAPIKYYVYRTT